MGRRVEKVGLSSFEVEMGSVWQGLTPMPCQGYGLVDKNWRRWLMGSEGWWLKRSLDLVLDCIRREIRKIRLGWG